MDLEGSGGGAKWKRARSCCSVSRISAVISWVLLSKAFVNLLGPGKGSSAMEVAHSEICERCEVSRVAMMGVVSRCALMFRGRRVLSVLARSRAAFRVINS